MAKNPYVHIETNSADYVDALRIYGKARKMVHADVVNSFAKDANFFCVNQPPKGVKRMKRTGFPMSKAFEPKPPKSGGTRKALGIEQKLARKSNKLVRKEDRERIRGRSKRESQTWADRDKGGLKQYRAAIWHALASGLRRTPDNRWERYRGVYRGEGNYEEAKRIFARKQSRRGAMAAGFLVSARKLGLTKKGAKDAQPKPGGSASKSTAFQAKRGTGGKISASTTNRVEGSYEVAKDTMDRAISAIVVEKRTFALNRLQQVNDKAMKGKL